ncbi:VWA domain-containing protein [Pseudomonas sp. 2FE]|uniref:VWA domain-containing protein n=1 Tax=Pseudomonas sp. 2FE TaxID=2502190 RepID=UPI0010F80337|nr:VWA domain-containing protein [Pseudomonas sp. 2FE]
MIALWPHWLRPFWLLILPLLGWLLWRLWHRQRRVGRWQMLLPAAFHGVLLSGGNNRGSRLPWIALGLAWLLALLALLGPGWQRVEQASQKRADPLVVLLELTPAMLASDVTPTRLEHAKRKLLDLLQARRDAQTAIVVFAGSAHTLVPLSDDLATTRNLLESLKPSIMPEAGHRADLAVGRALALLEQGAQGQGRLLLMGSTLDEQERQGIRQALGDKGERLHILGIGTAQGAPIAQEDGGFLKDEQGAILLPRLDSAGLKRFTRELGGRYMSARLDDSDLRSLGLLDGAQSLREAEPMRLATWADQGHWLLLPLLLLAACAGRRGWLFCLPLLLLSPQQSYAFEFKDLWLRPDQQGQRLLEAQRPVEAAQHFQNPQWQGLALYQAGDYAGAAAHFALGDTAAEHYNRGNALAKGGELEAALDAYEQALERQADLQPALKNKALVEQRLRQQQQQPADAQQQGSANAAQQQQNQPGQPQAGESDEQSASQSQPSEASSQDGESKAAGQPESQSGNPQAGQPGDDNLAKPMQAKAHETLGGERRQALEQWLRQIPDDPGELLRRKFWYEQQQRQEQPR